MRLLITAGNAQAPIDRVRCITNVFTGRTGARIAEAALLRGHHVTLATSHPETVESTRCSLQDVRSGTLNVLPFQAFAELEHLLRAEVTAGGYDAVIHAAAVTDFAVADVFARETPPISLPPAGEIAPADAPFRKLDPAVGKIKSTNGELWLRLVPTPKLIDQMRHTWGFRGVLVKFKLEVGIDEDQLRSIALDSCRQSHADLIVANTFETRETDAYLGWPDGSWRRVARSDLAGILLAEVERLHSQLARQNLHSIGSESEQQGSIGHTMVCEEGRNHS